MPYPDVIISIKRWAAFTLVIGLGLAIQLWAVLQWPANFDSDEAIFGLMARHTLQGQTATYMYGGDYLGSLEAIISAGFIALFGSTVPIFRLSSLVLFGLFLVLHAVLVTKAWGGKVALLSLLLLAFPGWSILWWTYRPIGAFGIMFVCGTTILLLTYTQRPLNWYYYVRLFALGLIIGLGVWSHPMILIYIAGLSLGYWLQTPEWANLYQQLSSYQLPNFKLTATKLLPAMVLSVVGLAVVAFFTNGCEPQVTWAIGQNVARLLLGVTIATLLVMFFAVSKRRWQLVGMGLTLGVGFSLGNFPHWQARLLYQFGGSGALLPSCPDQLFERGYLVGNELIPTMWGVPALTTLLTLPLDYMLLWLAAFLILSVASLYFVWTQQVTLCKMITLAPILPSERKTVVVIFLFIFPIILSILGSNTVDLLSVRYLLITWSASSVIVALFISRLTLKAAWVSKLLLGFLIVQIGFNNLIMIGSRWQANRTFYAPAAVAELEEFFTKNQVHGGYTDYWLAFTLDFLTAERLTLAPYNGKNRYPAYSEQVKSLPVQAYIFPVGRISAQGDQINTLIAGLSHNESAGPMYPWLLERLHQQVVLKRQKVAHWDVWLLSQPGKDTHGQ